MRAELGFNELGESPTYRPRLLCFEVMPGLEPEFYEPALERGLDAIIITTVPTGGIPNEGRYSFIPFVEKATSLKIPVYLLRGSLSASRKPENERRTYRRILTLYEPEVDAIRGGESRPEVDAVKSGATPLERPDASQIIEVVQEIIRVYAERPSYHEGIEKISRTFNSPEFMEEIRRIRER